ncbi:hypothetical protein [Leptospira perdikensis]|uniref:Uncharacterized protein n=1 Tax=Leptospira perdikensis TaxID=2484948 RepID=A0A4R9JKG1_9LEPT|nr:hypothetical protein [Leptospira perdikensis]TGL45980.1 hypothetical protein EHQ49_00925 [Leptospira perdikensis]
MRKITIILFSILVLTITVNAQEPKQINSNNLKERILEIEKTLEETKTRNSKEDLESRLQYSIEIIQSQDARFSSISALFGIISIVLGIYTLAIPFLTYVIAIRPARATIGKLKTDLHSFFQDYESNQIDKSIENLASNDVQIMKNAELYLSLNQHYKFNEKQLFSLFDLLEKGIEDSAQNIVKIIIFGNKCKYADKLYYNLINNGYNASNDYLIAKYLAINGLNSHKNEIRNYISISQYKQNVYFSLANNLLIYSSKELIKLLNEDEIISIFNKTEHESIIKTFNSYFKSKPIYSAFSNTKLYNLFNGV